MSWTRCLACVGTALAGLLLAPVPSASAHVHGVTPLSCTPAPVAVAGANQTNVTPAASANGGPISGVIPLANGGQVPTGGGSDAAVCTMRPTD